MTGMMWLSTAGQSHLSPRLGTEADPFHSAWGHLRAASEAVQLERGGVGEHFSLCQERAENPSVVSGDGC